jgi:hypothetical protein
VGACFRKFLPGHPPPLTTFSRMSSRPECSSICETKWRDRGRAAHLRRRLVGTCFRNLLPGHPATYHLPQDVIPTGVEQHLRNEVEGSWQPTSPMHTVGSSRHDASTVLVVILSEGQRLLLCRSRSDRGNRLSHREDRFLGVILSVVSAHFCRGAAEVIVATSSPCPNRQNRHVLGKTKTQVRSEPGPPRVFVFGANLLWFLVSESSSRAPR